MDRAGHMILIICGVSPILYQRNIFQKDEGRTMLPKSVLALILALCVTSTVWNPEAGASSRIRPGTGTASLSSFSLGPQTSRPDRPFPANAPFSALSVAGDPGSSSPDFCHHFRTHGWPSLECPHRHSGVFSGTGHLDCLLKEFSTPPTGRSSEEHFPGTPDRMASVGNSVLLPPPRPLSI